MRFRPLTLADRPAVLAICATVWDGDDYLPHVFDEWLAAPNAHFNGLELDDRLVAIARLRRFAYGEYWLEAIRVHGDYRGRGLAAHFHDYNLNLWRAQGEGGTVRLLTDTPTIARLCERTGFRRLFDVAFFGGAAQAGAHGFETLRALPPAFAYPNISRAPLFTRQQGLVDVGWRWRALNPAYFAELTVGSLVYVWRDALVLFRADDEHLAVRFYSGPFEQLPAFLTDARALAHSLGKQHLHWALPADADLTAVLSSNGMHTLYDGLIEHCYELAATA